MSNTIFDDNKAGSDQQLKVEMGKAEFNYFQVDIKSTTCDKYHYEAAV